MGSSHWCVQDIKAMEIMRKVSAKFPKENEVNAALSSTSSRHDPSIRVERDSMVTRGDHWVCGVCERY